MKKRSEAEIAAIVKNFGEIMKIAIEVQELPEDVQRKVIGQALDSVERKTMGSLLPGDAIPAAN